jgi:hypothetical protein
MRMKTRLRLQLRENAIRTRAKVKKYLWLYPSSSHHTERLLFWKRGDYFMMPQVARVCSNAGFEVLRVVARKSSTFQDITLCSLIMVNQYFGGTYSLCLLVA